jgi:predicted nucleic acid-binding protein
VTALIFNTSPLSHFALAGRLAMLDRLTAAYRRVAPQAVLDELRAGEVAHPPLADVRNTDWLEVVACDGLAELRAFAHYVQVLGAGLRDIGEASVLAWAEVNGGIAVIDERAGTQAAQARGVAVHGTLWLIANSLNVGELLLPEAERLVDQLRTTGARLPCSGAEFFEWAKTQGLLRP